LGGGRKGLAPSGWEGTHQKKRGSPILLQRKKNERTKIGLPDVEGWGGMSLKGGWEKREIPTKEKKEKRSRKGPFGKKGVKGGARGEPVLAMGVKGGVKRGMGKGVLSDRPEQTGVQNKFFAGRHWTLGW